MQSEAVELAASAPHVGTMPTGPVARYEQLMAVGPLLLLVIQVWVLPTGGLISAILARGPGPNEYGSCAVAASIVAWLQASIHLVFNGSRIVLWLYGSEINCPIASINP